MVEIERENRKNVRNVCKWCVSVCMFFFSVSVKLADFSNSIESRTVSSYYRISQVPVSLKVVCQTEQLPLNN